MRLTLHAQQRLQGRLGEITSVREVMDACCTVSDREQYVPVVVKHLPEFVVIPEDSDYTKCSKGDEVVAICREGHITTVMLRKSWSKSEQYHQ